MSDPLNIHRPARGEPSLPQTTLVSIERSLHRILQFTRYNIHDVINDPIARREVRNFYKLSKWIGRASEIGDLERQWNPLRA